MAGKGAKALDLDDEAPAVRDAYGRNRFGQGCLLARRLVERGVAFVEVTLADDRDSASASAIVEIIDLQGVVVGSRTGSASFERIPFEPLE